MPIQVAKLIKEAAEAAKLVPEHLQEAAFNRAYETLVTQAEGAPAFRMKPRDPGAAAKTKKKKAPTSTVAAANDALAALDRTAHPEINHNQPALHNALRLLQAAKDDLGIDGLSASAIAGVLVDEFRCRISRRRLSQALNDAGRFVNRRKEGNKVVFKLMGPGEDYLDSLTAREEAESTSTASTQKRTPKQKKSGSDLRVKASKGSSAPPKSVSVRGESYSIDRDINLRGGEGVPAFREFASGKKARASAEFNAVAVYYLDRLMKLEPVTLDHVYTCYAEVKRKPPLHFRQSFYDTKNKKGWIDMDANGNVSIPHRGVAFVEHDLPHETNDS